MSNRQLYLRPPLTETSDTHQWKKSNRTIAVAVAPTSNQLAVFPTPASLPHSTTLPKAKPAERQIWFSQWDEMESTRREFYSRSFLIFVELKRSLQEFGQKGPDYVTSSEAIIRYSEHCQSYIDLVRQHLETIEKNPHSDKECALFESMFTSLELFQLVYLPTHGYIDALVGSELLQWLNTNYVTNTEEEGAALLNSEQPWRDPSFWPYIKLCTLRVLIAPVKHFLTKVAAEHSEPLTRELSTYIVQALEEMPTAENFDHENDFFHAHRAWKTSLHRLRRTLDRQSSTRFDGKNEIQEIVALLEGKYEAIHSICSSSGFGWKEALCAYGIWVNERLKRVDLAEVALEIFSSLPVDPTSKEDQLHAAILSIDTVKVSSCANELDLWLVAHLTDIMEPLDLLEANIIGSLRQHFIIGYADALLADPALWRLTVEYLATCGPQGLQIASEVLLRVPLGILEVTTGEATSNAVTKASEGSPLEELLSTCEVHELLDTAQSICRIASRMFASRKMFGKAIEYCARALDTRGLARITDLLLDEYLSHGSSHFVHLVDQVPAHFLYPDMGNAPPEMFSSRLRFLVKYAEFHHTVSLGRKADAAGELALMLENEIAPRSWWALLLRDAAELINDDDMVLTVVEVHILLNRLEHVCTRARFGAGGDYLGALKKQTGSRSDEEALQYLEAVRLNLVRYASKCMSGIGGKGAAID